MNKKDLIQEAATNAGMSQSEITKALDSITECIKRSLKKEEPVILVGFGTFSVKERAGRQGRNPSTGQPMQIPAKKFVKFNPGKGLDIDFENTK